MKNVDEVMGEMIAQNNQMYYLLCQKINYDAHNQFMYMIHKFENLMLALYNASFDGELPQVYELKGKILKFQDMYDELYLSLEDYALQIKKDKTVN